MIAKYTVLDAWAHDDVWISEIKPICIGQGQMLRAALECVSESASEWIEADVRSLEYFADIEQFRHKANDRPLNPQITKKKPNKTNIFSFKKQKNCSPFL